MNLYKLHTDAKNKLDGYANMNDLAYSSIKKVWPDGDIEYRNVFGQLNRQDGPAWIATGGTEHWFKNGKRHRENGPAVTWANGNTEYWINDKRVTNNELI